MEDRTTYGTDSHELPDYTERVQSQLPALHLLIQLGWQYLTPAQCVQLRDDRLGGAILEPILTQHIREKARFDFKGQSRPFTENAAANAVQTLKAFRATGATHQNEQAYDLLCLGTDVPQTIDGDTKSFKIHFIDWKNPANNTYHCTAEFKVERIGHQKHYIPDIVLFVNGIPLVVIECKRSAYEDVKKKPIDLAIAQLREYQEKEGIPQIFLSSQLLLALARDKAEYGTTGTPRKFWSTWKELDLDAPIRELLTKPLPLGQSDHLLSFPFVACAAEFRSVLAQGRAIYEQDRALYALCRPERLLALIYKFIVFDNGEKKIARYQQFFAVRDILARVSGPLPTANCPLPTEPRPGGVVWHTQGSGKSLTMVMLAKTLALASQEDPSMQNPKIILVTDRVDLDDEIWGTFRACGLDPEQADSGKHLVELLTDSKTHVVTTTIHKFVAAATSRNLKQADRNTFVLVDEGHRSNYGEQHTQMQIALKGACFIAFTGTPLAKAVKNTFVKFGDLFKPPYTIARAVEDKAVVPLLYEARHVPQPVEQNAIDSWFEKLTLGLTPEQKADLKRKFSTERQLNKAAQKVRMVAWDINLHYAMTYQGTGMKGQLVSPDKATALLYRQFLNEFGQVSSEVLISPPADREGEEDRSAGPSQEEKTFWESMMDRYGSEKKYNQQLINAFKHTETPEIIIVVDKLITGFDAPCNTVLYLARKLKGHTLLQAIARVNRLFDGKEYGLILDYSGVIAELDEAIDFYTQLADYDREDLAETVSTIQDRAAQLPQLHSDLWELFTEVKGAKDPEAYETHLRDPERRNRFYDRFGLFARTLALAFSSTSFLENTPDKTVRTYKKDLKFFQNLRAAVSVRYQERVDFSEYEPKIKKLIDSHVGAGEVVQLCKPINLLDAAERNKVLEDQGKSTEAKADMIASATRHVIETEMVKDPAFYQRFSKLLEDVLAALEAKRIQALEALGKIKDIATKVATHTEDDTPPELVGKDMARRYFGCVREDITAYTTGDPAPASKIALAIVDRIRQHKIRDWRENQDALNLMRGEIDDIFFEVCKTSGITIPLERQDKLIDTCIEVARANDD
jgi:type I restriction enzyme R subunit